MAPTLEILLVEDDPDDAMIVMRQLPRWVEGHDVPLRFRFTRVPSIAALLGRTEAFDVVISDLHLADGAPRDVLSAVRGMYPTEPLVVLTGMDDDSPMDEMEFRVDHRLHKDETHAMELTRRVIAAYLTHNRRPDDPKVQACVECAIQLVMHAPGRGDGDEAFAEALRIHRASFPATWMGSTGTTAGPER